MKRIREVTIYLSAIALFFTYQSHAQGYVENALLFSSNRPGGSARMQGIGGAQVALGGDYSSALSNPAGLGMFNRSEFTISPGMSFSNADASFSGNTKSDSRSVFNIPGLSYVHHLPRDNNGFLGGSFAVSLTRTNDFNNAMRYEGYNSNTSMIDYFIDQANGTTTSQFDPDGINYNSPTGLAYYNYLIGPQSLQVPPGPDNQYFTDILGVPFQEEKVQTKGSSNQWSFSYGGNYQDKLFFGAGIGITSLRYKSHTTYTETFTNDPNFFGFQLDEKLTIDGSGVNATLGLIYRPANFIQIGLSYLTPTYYQLSSNYFARMDSGWNGYDYYHDGSKILGDEFATTDEGGVTNDYSLTTPGKLSTGLALISKYGFLSADLEMTNPGNAKYSSQVTSMSSENSGIRASYQQVINYRLGAEFRYNIVRLRGGYGTFGNPWKNDYIKFDNNYWSAGAGVRLRDFYIDVAYQSRSSKSYYFPYIFSDGYADPVTVKSKLETFVVTAGFTF